MGAFQGHPGQPAMSAGWQPVRCWWCSADLGTNAQCHACRSFNRRVVLPRMAARMTDAEFDAAVRASPALMASMLEQVRRDSVGSEP